MSAMRVFEVKVDVQGRAESPHEEYQVLRIDNRMFGSLEEYSKYTAARFTFAGVPIKDWSPPPMRSPYPKRAVPDFWHISAAGVFAVGPQALEIVRGFVAKAGQLLPLPHKNQELTICNVLECVICIDEECSKWRFYSARPEERVAIEIPFFITEKIPQSTLFKARHPQLFSMYAWEESCDPALEFKACVEQNKLTGLKFVPVWSEENGIIPYQPERK
jgi:hypothetical protein